MFNALKARLRASVCLTLTPETWREVIKAFTLMIFRLVRPATVAARQLGCGCIRWGQFVGNCPYHGNAIQRVLANG